MGRILTYNAPEAPEAVVSRIKQIDPNLTLKFVEFPPDQEGNRPSWWAVAFEWDKSDSRFRLVDSGDLPRGGTFDVLGYLPLECGVHDSFDLIKNMLYQARNAPNAGHLLWRVDEYNRKVTDAALNPVIERASEVVEANAAQMFAKETGKTVPKVFMQGGK